MSKKIVYIATDHGIDGKDKESILYATWKEDELIRLHKTDKSKQWRTLTERIVDVDKAKKQALAKLNGIDRLVLGLPNWLEDKF